MIPTGLRRRITACLGGPTARRVASYAGLLPQIEHWEQHFAQLDDTALRKESLSLRYRAKSGEPLGKLLPPAFGLVRQAAQRALGMRHFDVQVIGGIAMFRRAIAEMQTGEGKTLTATLPLYLAALNGRGAHLATANDYLAQRDAEWMRPLYGLLGISVGVIQSQMPPAARRQAYGCDITYGTAKEFGFDFLRDRLLARHQGAGQSDFLGAMLGHAPARPVQEKAQRELRFLLVDEADSILIDEGRTPLVISAAPTAEQAKESEAYRWAASISTQFAENEHYAYEYAKRKVELLPAGRQLARRISKPDAMQAMGMFSIYEFVERAIKVEREMVRDQHYVMRDGEIVIVDEFTGRLAEGRKWRAGLHQAVEAREQVKVTFETSQAAKVTVQDFVLQYQQLCGMTGTAASSARELKKLFGLSVLVIPTNRPPIRQRLPQRVFGSGDAKWDAIVEEVAAIHAQGRPVLIGTRSIDKSELLSRRLSQRGIEHQVLNANRLAEEAEIIAQAGHQGKVTVATNMAGRGTDIKLGPGVAELGGLHVVCTEMHEAERVDRQLIGRCGRQGDPGTFRQFLALDDDILRDGYSLRQVKRWKKYGKKRSAVAAGTSRRFRIAQRRIERRHFRDRKILLYRERQRAKMQIQMGQDPYLDAPD